ncbi:MocR-like pyridoxine biosynthesis transcription factor PdxR [Mangrovibrevibacter kandeliae]|uniref:MocR-like pyridoxine biosynthesis transcription factor PdxR n=1 Tax=Mangrovibrevibacter kandeliae TaxID=2968473 RepID=UPI0021199F90|nr:PLP-dependent aminotransferase family protein [Aurantimonas sp. CSK15Z-1]MCQ8784170.1 PLP-dependent aminotransferase family protein [Aurantimonas sp. CSK15Z-1]MCQ8784269.1 PLP-dependent aminotransferase family protein [Aurantimonas sp. CSK15Z-1]
MFDRIFADPLDPARPLQKQIQERIVEAILAGLIVPHEPLPATRVLSRLLDVSRNTVTLVYERMAQDGYLVPVDRRGYFVDEAFLRQQTIPKGRTAPPVEAIATARHADLTGKMRQRPSSQPSITKPKDWHRHPYPFVYGQVAADPTSVSRWRDCIRQASRNEHLKSWMSDLVDADDPELVEQIQRRILPRRGFRARPEEILVTNGAQSALYLLARLFCGFGITVGVEDPGYADARNIFALAGAEIRPIPVDGNGLKVDERLAGCSLVHVTPSHQAPTNVTMTMQRRLALLEAAERHDILIIEDDYEHEVNHVGPRQHALKGYDRCERVIHVGSLSKPVFPGLRLGFLVAPPEVVVELRALRRLVYRHPSALDQRAMAIFLADGHYDAHIRRQQETFAVRWAAMLREIERRLPDCRPVMTTGGSAIWLKLPPGVRPEHVQAEALRRGVVVEVGDVHFAAPTPERNYLRLGFGAIATEAIAPGLARLADAIAAAAETQTSMAPSARTAAAQDAAALLSHERQPARPLP